MLTSPLRSPLQPATRSPFEVRSGGGSAPAVNAILIEDGSALLLEDGTEVLME